jgi:membrane protein implicated in regulation of membrane protease activity
MLALGVILILVAAGAVLAAVAGASDQTSTFDLGVFSVEMNTLGVFLSGAATVLLLVVGLELVRAGVRRANRRRKERKELNRLTEQLGEREAASRTPAEPRTETPAEPPAESPAVDTADDTADDTARTRAAGPAEAPPNREIRDAAPADATPDDGPVTPDDDAVTGTDRPSP